MNEQQTFQSQAQLTALKIHAVWEKIENVVLFPFRWLSEAVSQTGAWKRAEAGTLRLVK